MAEELLITAPGTITTHLTPSLLAVALLTSFGSSMLYGYNLAVVNSPAGYIKDFYNQTVVRRNGSGLNGDSLTLMYSLTVSVFAIGGLLGSLMVGILVTKFGRKGTVVNSTILMNGKMKPMVKLAIQFEGPPHRCRQIRPMGLAMNSSRRDQEGDARLHNNHNNKPNNNTQKQHGQCFTIERWGRRPLIIGGFAVMGICCAGITLSLILQSHVSIMRYVSVGCVVGIIAGFCIGPAGVPFLITAELFKQSHRPAAYTVGGSLNWMANFTIGFIFPFLQAAAGSYCYLVFSGVCLGVAVYVFAVIPETKNKTFVEISQMFASKEGIMESDQMKLKKMNGYGTLENGSLDFDSSSSTP
ncbi:solute carrier family 2 member 15a [Engraulis encrasicolus]|uniref:solute carrier family 2 member 15a n=1 Tax=Engraulis encrasicolus TaxID=184585 RepID=UPI002FD25A28